jgi:DNA-binding ferritin-like protein
VAPYRTLEPPLETASAASASGDINESAEMLRLQEENKRLSEEVRITMETMGRMLNEYSAMFAGGGSEELDKEKIKSMFEEQAESLGEKLDTAMEQQQAESMEESPAESSGEASQESAGPTDAAEQQDEGMEEDAEAPVMFGEVEAAPADADEGLEVGEVTVEEIPVVSDESEGDAVGDPEQGTGEDVKKE